MSLRLTISRTGKVARAHYCAYNKPMDITYDPAKNERNVRERALSFDRAAEFDFHTAVYRIDDRQDYGETRFRAMGYLEGRLHALVFVEHPTGIRVISFRKANSREIKGYESTKQSPA